MNEPYWAAFSYDSIPGAESKVPAYRECTIGSEMQGDITSMEKEEAWVGTGQI